ncbi:MAG TPA: MBL fold metallo-hydrolase [Bacteroidales bacterium]|nr:MBL fold metallo-hydrolase [Bacteroidales bacterium]
MKITFYGAAGGVTGTSYYCETPQARILVDCGMFQGGRKAEAANRKAPPVDYQTLDAIVLTHAHLDHCGRLPLAARAGYRGPVFGTPATIDLSALVLRDSLKVQTGDLEKLNRMRARTGKPALEADFDEKDVENAIRLMKPIPYHESFEVAPGMSVIVDEAGHILGSGSLKVTVSEGGTTRSVIFSGDLGARGLPIVRDPEPFREADMVIMESTYGDRDHKPLQETINEAIGIIGNAIRLKGKILVPAFAIGRTQDLIYYLEQAFRQGGLPRIPIYIDSPMAIQATKIYLGHPELFDEEMKEFIASGEMERDKDYLRPTVTAEESRRLNEVEGPCIIIAGSGMCNAGRILHHLRHNLWRNDTSVLIVGYQADGTLGRSLVEGAPSVRIFGERIAVRAQIHKLGGFSAHAGQSDLLNWFNALAPARPRVVLTHGEDKAREALANILRHRYGLPPYLPQFGDTVEV